MQVVENQVVKNTTVVLDDKSFVNCHYKDCTLLYSGGDFVHAKTVFETCKMNFTGAAQRTIAVLNMFGVLRPSGPAPRGPKTSFGFGKLQ